MATSSASPSMTSFGETLSACTASTARGRIACSVGWFASALAYLAACSAFLAYSVGASAVAVASLGAVLRAFWRLGINFASLLLMRRSACSVSSGSKP